MVDHTQDEIKAINEYDFLVSYGYKYIVRREVLENLKCPIFNLHISYLPHNRGAHPNFWSFYDNTPTGVTIHLMDAGIDTGPIVNQRYVNFKKEDDTFAKTYDILIYEIEKLFLETADSLIMNTWKSQAQQGKGSFHYLKDIPLNFNGWNSIIEEEITRLKNRNKVTYD